MPSFIIQIHSHNKWHLTQLGYFSEFPGHCIYKLTQYRFIRKSAVTVVNGRFQISSTYCAATRQYISDV